VSGNLICTDCISTCRVYIIHGVCDGTPFAYLEHSSYALGSRMTPLDYLKIMLKRFKRNIEKSLLAKTSVSNVANLRCLRLFVAGGAKSKHQDHERETISLLVNPNGSVYDHIRSILKDDCADLFEQLAYRTIIIDQITYELSDRETEEAFKSKLIFLICVV
jgi:hypothetical protein